MNLSPADSAAPRAAVELQVGQRVTLEARRGRGVGTVYRSRIEQLQGDLAYVLAPMAERQVVSIPLNAPLRVGMRLEGSYYGFDTAVVEHIFHPQFLLGVRLPEVMERRNERAHYRLPGMIQPDAALLVNDEESVERRLHATIVNISGGGTGLVSPELVRAGELICLHFPLGEARMQVLTQVVAVDAPSAGRFNHRVHCQFLNMERRTREEIVRFVFRAQREQIRRGAVEEDS